MRAQRANLEGLDREFVVIHRAGGGGEVPNILHRLVEEQELGDILLDELELPVAGEVGDVFDRAGNEIVDADDAVAAGEQQIDQMRTEKARRAGDNGGWATAWSRGAMEASMGGVKNRDSKSAIRNGSVSVERFS